MNSKDNFLYFLVGVGLGAVGAILYAPKSGSETRAFLRSKAEEGGDYVTEAVDTATQTAREKVERVKRTAADGLNRGRKMFKAPLDELSSAVEVGKQAYRDAQETLEG